MPEPTSSSGGATPAAGSPETGTPASSGATPPAATLTLEEALKKIAELEHAHKNAREQADRHAKSLSKYEQAQKEAELAKLSETEKLTAQHSELQAKHAELERRYQERVISAEVQLQAANLGIRHPEKVFRLIDTSELEFDDDGAPKNAKALVEKLLKEMPELGPEPKAEPNAQNANRAPAVPAMNPGRSSIQQPGQAQPGRVPGWHEVYKRP